MDMRVAGIWYFGSSSTNLDQIRLKVTSITI
jgi:hypothetical protein